MEYFNAFWVGGLICVVGQLLIDLTRLTPARIMVLFVTSGVALGALGLYGPLAEFAGCGATVPLTGFGWALSEGVRKAVEEEGFFGASLQGQPGRPQPSSLGLWQHWWQSPGTNRDSKKGLPSWEALFLLNAASGCLGSNVFDPIRKAVRFFRPPRGKGTITAP